MNEQNEKLQTIVNHLNEKMKLKGMEAETSSQEYWIDHKIGGYGPNGIYLEIGLNYEDAIGDNLYEPEITSEIGNVAKPPFMRYLSPINATLTIDGKISGKPELNRDYIFCCQLEGDLVSDASYSDEKALAYGLSEDLRTDLGNIKDGDYASKVIDTGIELMVWAESQDYNPN